MDVLIVGAGTMGRWFGETVDADLAFADVDEAAARTAADAVGGRTISLETDDGSRSGGATETFDAVCIAVPIGHVEAAIEAHAPRAERALLDVSGVMEPALEAMGTHGPDLERVSLHPLFAPDRAPGSIAVVRGETGPVTDSILDSLAAAGNELVETTAAEHDDAMASVQASAHAAVLAFALAADRVPEEFETPIYGGMRDLVERMSGGTPRVYADIQRTFEGADDVAAAARRIADADPDEVEALYREASGRWNVGGDSAGAEPDDDSRTGVDDDSRSTDPDDDSRSTDPDDDSRPTDPDDDSGTGVDDETAARTRTDPDPDGGG